MKSLPKKQKPTESPCSVVVAKITTMAAAELDAKKLTEDEWKAKLTAEEYRILREKGTERPGTGEYNKCTEVRLRRHFTQYIPPGASILAIMITYSMYVVGGEQTGVYCCAGCGTALYTSSAKFDSGCGWPAFWAELPGTVERTTDLSGGRRRVEITCKACGGHLGHVFDGEGFPNPVNSRHCVNSVSIKLQKDQSRFDAEDAKMVIYKKK